MKKIGIVTDSHSSISPEEAKRLGVFVLPSSFQVDGQMCHEGVDLTREEFFKKQVAGAEIFTSQPSVPELMEIWDEALLVYEKILYIPISSGLSGSCSTAALHSYEESYKGKVYVVDNGRVSVPQFCTILDAFDLIERGLTPEEIKETLEEYRADEVIYVAIDDIAHLKKGGRISPTAAVAASILNIKPIMKFDVGTIDVYKKCRGMNRAKKEMFEAIRHDLETKFRSWYERGDYYLMTATAVEEEDNESFVKEVQQAFPGVKVHSGLLALATCAHIGYGGLGIGISCKPRCGEERPVVEA